MKSLFVGLFSWICVLLVIVGLIKWKTTWLDSDPEKTFKNGSEAYYIDKIAKRLGGETEVRISGGRIDIETDEFAIEVERAEKWKESIGQSLWYALNKNKKPKIILLLRSDEQDYKYVTMLGSTLKANNIEIEVELEYME